MTWSEVPERDVTAVQHQDAIGEHLGLLNHRPVHTPPWFMSIDARKVVHLVGLLTSPHCPVVLHAGLYPLLHVLHNRLSEAGEHVGNV